MAQNNRTGITKVRNESHIIEETLKHFLQWCDEIIVLDDISTDNTVEICESIPNVRVIKNTEYIQDRPLAELTLRKRLLAEVNTEWCIYFDADERIDWDFSDTDHDAVRMKLFDFHITPEDIDKKYSDREWVDPTPREIIMAFRTAKASYNYRDQREPTIDGSVLNAGCVRHYGKAISVEHWENKCDYYASWEEPYKTKWINRKGKAVKEDYRSDFGEPLVKYADITC